jgi:hypothetical protein
MLGISSLTAHHQIEKTKRLVILELFPAIHISFISLKNETKKGYRFYLG